MIHQIQIIIHQDIHLQIQKVVYSLYQTMIMEIVQIDSLGNSKLHQISCNHLFLDGCSGAQSRLLMAGRTGQNLDQKGGSGYGYSGGLIGDADNVIASYG